jgi:hypothetical protein
MRQVCELRDVDDGEREECVGTLLMKSVVSRPWRVVLGQVVEEIGFNGRRKEIQ